MLKSIWTIKVYIIFSILLTGCGFHLRGVVNKESVRWLNKVAIVIQQAHQDLEPLLKEQLKAYNIDIMADPALADYWLIIDNETMEQNISSISSSTTPRQYQLIYTVQFKLQQTKGVEILPLSRVIVTRQVTMNSNRILGSNDEAALQKNEMRRDAALQIMYRLSRISANTPHQAPQNKRRQPYHAD